MFTAKVGVRPSARRDAVERHPVREPGEEALGEVVLVGADRVPARLLDVLDRRDEAREELVLLRPGLEAGGERIVGRGPHLVRAQLGEQLRAGEEEPQVRPEELVRRAQEDVRARGGDVDRAVRCVMDGVDPGERARVVRESGDPGDVAHGADGVRSPWEGDDAGLLGELPLQVVEVERAVLVDVDEADGRARGPPRRRARARRSRRGRGASRGSRRRRAGGRARARA